MQVDLKYTMAIMEKLINTPSPSGYTHEAMAIVEKELKALGIPYRYIHKGGLIATLKGKDDEKHRTVSGHIDTLGAMVREIRSDGTLRLTQIGGYMWQAVEGEYCTVRTDDNKDITGTIMTSKPSVHVFGGEAARNFERSEENMYVRLDAIVKSAEDTRKLGIENGNFVFFEPRFQVTDTGFVKARHLDDKASVAIILGVLKQVLAEGKEIPHTTHFFFTNYEEVGHGAAYGTPEKTVEFLAVDMGCVGGGLAGDEQKVSIAAKDSSGPYDYHFKLKLIELSKKNNIDYAVDIFPFYGSDASAAMRGGANIRHGLIGTGVQASHAWERTHMDGIRNTFLLVYHYLLSED